MSVLLANISTSVDLELKEFNRRFRTSMISHVPLVNLIAKYLIRTKGKQVRPMLVLLAAQASGGITDATYRAAGLVELLHTATLIHDDVIDEAETRRGLPSIKALWRNKVGVLMGDYLLARGLLLTVETHEYHLLDITSTAVRRMSEGELYQLQKARQLNIDEDAYFRIISDKTASLLSTCCELGAASVVGAGNHPFRDALKSYGEAVGIVFQIRDDLFGYDSADSTIGKPAASDLQEKKMTLPLIHALRSADAATRKRVLHLVKSGKAAKQGYREVIAFTRQNGGVDYAHQKAHEFANAARQALSALPESDAKLALDSFVDYVMDRDR